MFTQFLGTTATVYGVLAALKSLLQTRQMLARRTSRGVSAGFLASYAGGYAIWLTYGLSTGSLPLIIVDTVGLLCAGLTLAVALSLRIRSPRPGAPRSEMDRISEEYGADQAASGRARSGPVVSVRRLTAKWVRHPARSFQYGATPIE